MKLSECIELAKACGLTTLGEAYDNIAIHATQLMILEEIENEMEELVTDIRNTYGIEILDPNLDYILI